MFFTYTTVMVEPPSNRTSTTSTGLGIDMSSHASPSHPTSQAQRFARPHHGHGHSSSTSSIPKIHMPSPSDFSTPRRAQLRRPKSQSSLGMGHPAPGELFHGQSGHHHSQYQSGQPDEGESPILPWRQPSFRKGFQQGYQRIISGGSGAPRYGSDQPDETLAGPRYEQQAQDRERSSSFSMANGSTAPVPRPRRDRQLTAQSFPGDMMTPQWERRGSVWSPPTPSADLTPSNNRALPSRLSRGANLPWSTSLLSPASASPAYQDKRRSYGPGVAVQSALGSPYNPRPVPDHLGSIKTTGSTNFPMRPEGRKRALSEGECQLHREGTLLTAHATSKRASAELGIMLGNSSRKATKSRLLPQGELPIEEKMAKLDKVKLEARKGSKAKVEVDVILENDEVVEGGEIRGRLEVRVRKAKRTEKVWIGSGKIRVVGYEEHSNTSARHIFYHYPHALPSFTPYATEEEYHNPLFASPPDDVGYRQAAEGNWVIPFSMRLPVDGGAKGGWSLGPGKSGVRYVVVGSIKLHTPETKKRAIAHFYRPCVVYPRLDPAETLAPRAEARMVQADGGLGWSISGHKGRVTLRAKLQRDVWVAGQKVWAGVEVENMSARKVKSFNLALIRTVTVYTAPTTKTKTIDAWASPDLSLYKPNKISKKLWEEVVAAPTGGTSGHLGAMGWWTGVEPGAKGSWQCHLGIPPDCVTVTRSRLLDVAYLIRITLNNAVYVDLPLTVINFLSLDPPPGSCGTMEPAPVRTSGQALLNDAGPSGNTAAKSSPIPTPANQTRIIDWAYGSHPLPTGSSEVRERFSFPLPRHGGIPAVRPTSLQSSPGERYRAPTNHSADDLLAQRPAQQTAGLTRSASIPPALTRPGAAPRRDTTMSYLSAVESSDEDHDLAMIEARRRRGRQQSLAAIMGNRIENTVGEEEEEEEIPTPPSQTFAPFSGEPSPQAADVEVAEARNDLDFIRAEEEGHAASEHEFERDTESRYLEHDLQADGACRSRMGSSAGLSVAELSVSEYPTTEANVTPPMAPPAELHTQPADHIYLNDSAQASRKSSINPSTPLPPRRAYGSIAASAISAESEIGQVFQAFRRDLSMKAPRRPSEPGLRKESLTPRVAPSPPSMNRLPFTSTYIAVPRSHSLTSGRKAEQISPRSNSLDTTSRRPAHLAVPKWGVTIQDAQGPSRRPTAPAVYHVPLRASPKTIPIPVLRSSNGQSLFREPPQAFRRQPSPAPVSPKSYVLGPALFSDSRRPSSPLARRMHSPIPENRSSEERQTRGMPGLSPSDVGDSSSSHDSHGSQCESHTMEDDVIEVGPESEEDPVYYPESRHGSAFELDDRSAYSSRTPATPKSPCATSDRFGSITRQSPSGPRSRHGSSPKVSQSTPTSRIKFPLPSDRNCEGRTTYTAVFDARRRGEALEVNGTRERWTSATAAGDMGRASSRASMLSTSTTATMAELALLHHAISSGHLDAPSLRRSENAGGTMDDSRDLL